MRDAQAGDEGIVGAASIKRLSIRRVDSFHGLAIERSRPIERTDKHTVRVIDGQRMRERAGVNIIQ